MTAVQALAARLAATSIRTLPPNVLDVARRRLFDTLGCHVAGALTPEGRLLARLPAGGSLDRLRVMTGAIRCTELDDIHLRSCATVGSIVVPAALTAALTFEADDQTVLCGLVAGYEAMTRYGVAIDGAHRLYQGVWPTYFTGPFAAAATTATVAGLSEDRLAAALAIAAARSTGVTARVGGPASSRWFLAGCAAADGCLAALAAVQGMAGDPHILEQGVPRATRVELDLSAFQQDAERWWILDVDTKPFRTSRQALAATDALLRLLDRRPGAAVERLRAWVPAQVLAMVDNPASPLGLQRQFALAIDHRSNLWNPAAEPLAGGLSVPLQVEPEDGLTGRFPHQWGGKVEVRWAGGHEEALEVLAPRGSAGDPFGWPALEAKHRRVMQAMGAPDGWIEPLLRLCREFGGGRSGQASAAELLRLAAVPS